MIILSQEDLKIENRHSSKGNQMKWLKSGKWYKADYTGYEGMAEYMVSHLLKYSNLDEKTFILYETEEIQYSNAKYRGCSSENFLQSGWQLVTLERLFQNFYGESLYRSIYHISELENRIRFLVEQTERITGLTGFGQYLSKLLTVDALFLNEDRHTHNIAVLQDENDKYHLCPIFDNGGALLSDITMDYPLGFDIYDLIDQAKSKTFCRNFEEQLEAVEKLYGQSLKFYYGRKEIEELINTDVYYSEEIKKRVENILLEQRRKYAYLF